MVNGSHTANQGMAVPDVYGEYNGYVPSQFPPSDQSFGNAV